MHGNGTLPLIGIQCFYITDLAKAMDKEELTTAVSCTGKKLAEGINSIGSELTSYGMFRFPELAKENLLYAYKESNWDVPICSDLLSTLSSIRCAQTNRKCKVKLNIQNNVKLLSKLVIIIRGNTNMDETKVGLHYAD
jgi:hypothetical protein